MTGSVFSASMSIASFTRLDRLADRRALAAGLRGGEEHRLDLVEIALLAHALHEHRADHAAPADESDSQHLAQSIESATLVHSAATTASPISAVPTLRVPARVNVRRAQALAQHFVHRGFDAVGRLGAGRASSAASSPPTGSSPADWRCPCRRCRAPSRGSARTGPCRSRRARPTAACRSSRSASTPRRTGCRRTCCR